MLFSFPSFLHFFVPFQIKMTSLGMLFFALSIFCFFSVAELAPLSLRCLSWNVNGVAKLKLKQHEMHLMLSHDVVLLQETFCSTRESVLDLPGFIPHHQLGRRHQWGLSSFMRIEAFTGGTLHRVPCPFDWMVVSRWRRESDLGLVIVNIYLPVHTDGFGRSDAEAALVFLGTLRSDFPTDGFIMGGDLNVDLWRVQEHRLSGRQIPTSTRSGKFLYFKIILILF
jgi:exonuclease III